MRRHSALVLPETYIIRMDSFEILKKATNARFRDSVEIRRISGNLDDASSRFADEKIAVTFAAFADLLRIVALLVEWRRAVIDAEPEPDRFRRGAMEQLTLWKSDYGTRPEAHGLLTAALELGVNFAIAEVGAFCERLAATPLAVGIYGDIPKPTINSFIQSKRERERDNQPEVNVAFLKFAVDGERADQIHFLSPHETHDLEIEVRVSRWPTNATDLQLSPITIETASTYDFPKFSFAKPDGDPPFVIRQRGRATIRAAQALRAQPFEFRYAPEFLPKESEQPVAVGHRTLRIESIDFRRSPLTGYPLMDQRLLEMRNSLRRLPAVPQGDLETALTLAVPLAALAARSVQDDLFPKPISEAEFQRQVRDELRRRPEIGAELEEHPHAGGGETDLSLRGVRLELKVEPTRRLELAHCQLYVEQAAAYAVGSGKRLGLLCVLDASPKGQAPFPAEDGVTILFAKPRLPILTILIEGGLATPSALSRRKKYSNR